jgi:chromosome segregation ATPase
MAIMLAKTYHALKAAGAPEDDAIAAAEELANYENRLTSIDNRLSIIESRLTNLDNELTQFRAEVNARFSDVSSRFSDVGSRFTMLTWAVGINGAATIAILGILLRGHGP